MTSFKLLRLLLCLCLLPSLLAQEGKDSKDARATQAIEKAINALGGQAFLQVKDITSSGKYYRFRKGQNSLPISYQDQTRLPDKSRYEEGGKKDRDVYVFNLEAGKGWILETQKGVREAEKEEVDRFKKTVKHAMENVLRTRYKDPSIRLFYYGPGEVSSKKRSEAVELLDDENDSVIVYFDLSNHYPLKIEYTETDPTGRKSKVEEEFSNWHNVQGVMTPFRIDTYVDGEESAERFVDRIAYNNNLPDSLFTKPPPPPQKRKK